MAAQVLIAEGGKARRGRGFAVRRTPPGVPAFKLAGNRLADGRQRATTSSPSKAHGEELVRKERVGEGKSERTWLARVSCLASAAFAIASPQSMRIEHLAARMSVIRTCRAHLPFRGMAELLQVIRPALKRFGTHLGWPGGA